MSARRYRQQTSYVQAGKDGSAVLSLEHEWTFDYLDCELWPTHVLRVCLSFECTRTAPASIALDFIDPVELLSTSGGSPPPVRKRILLDTTGTVLSFVSDCLGLGWMVPARPNGMPMRLRFAADGGGNDMGASALILEWWWEARAMRCDE